MSDHPAPPVPQTSAYTRSAIDDLLTLAGVQPPITETTLLRQQNQSLVTKTHHLREERDHLLLRLAACEEMLAARIPLDDAPHIVLAHAIDRAVMYHPSLIVRLRRSWGGTAEVTRTAPQCYQIGYVVAGGGWYGVEVEMLKRAFDVDRDVEADVPCHWAPTRRAAIYQGITLGYTEVCAIATANV